MEIRNATIEDWKEIAAVEAACFPPAEAATEESIRRRLEMYANHFWLLFEEDQLISFVNGMVTNEPDLRDEMYEDASLHDENGEWQMIFGVDTIPSHRRKGYAEKVLWEIIKCSKEQGRKGLVLTCKDYMIHYYAKFGFVNEGVSESVHGNVMWYQMRLTF